ncbi:hypothetical protein Scep_007054 [Stephania cephalantha]|uniref:Uncharacterized protein n=1 Tax=Stephania cephalantha TaxID=152367 RepID=A0AAP0PLE8_9MAGN
MAFCFDICSVSNFHGCWQGKRANFTPVFLCKGLSYKIRFFLDLETAVLFLNRMSHYFDIDDIIMEDEVWGSRRRGLGLQGATHGPKTFKLSLAPWASCARCGPRHQILQLQKFEFLFPGGYNNSWICSHSQGSFKTPLKKIGDRTIGSFLLYAFMNRFKDILSKAHSVAFAVAPRFFPLLTKEEMQHEIH